MGTNTQFAFPASFAQQRLWFIYQLNSSNPTYNMPMAWRLRGPLDKNTLHRSLTELVNRHESLRTIFAVRDGELNQVVSSDTTFDFVQLDVGHEHGVERETVALRLLDKESRHVFDLTKGPLLRCSLIRLDETNHIFLINKHHIISDGWSANILSAELGTLYTDIRSDRALSLQQLELQYADFTLWQRERLSSLLQTDLAFWKDAMKGISPTLDLPTDRKRPTEQRFQGIRHPLKLDAALTKKLSDISRREGTTLYMTLLATFGTLLHRYSGQESFFVASPIAGRESAQLEEVVGCCLNTLPLPMDCSGAPTFSELLRRVRNVTLNAYAHQHLPFERLVKEMQPDRDLSRSPIAQVMLVLQNTPTTPLQLKGVEAEPLEVHHGTAKFDLTLDLYESAQGLQGVLEYDTDLFDDGTISDMICHWKTMLSHVVDNPNRPIQDIPLLSDRDKQKILVDWNAPKYDTLAPNQCIHQLVETQVVQTPHETAIIFQGIQLTYQQLNERANRLAHYLKSRGVGRGMVVGICVDRSVEMVVGVLAILKAGAAYLPLDPSNPPSRLAFMLADIQASLLVVREKQQEYFSEFDLKTVCLATDDPNICKQNSDNPQIDTAPEDLAYVIYTSGSTGQPKGVEVSHANVVNLLHGLQQEPGLTTEDTVLAVTTLSFDVSVPELFLPLSVGARVVVADQDQVTDGSKLLQIIEDTQATLMTPTPATWRMLLAAGWKGSSQLNIVSTGEALPIDLAKELLPRGKSLWNLYGPTETTVWATGLRVNSTEQNVTIGRPICNASTYIVDKYMQPVPIGVPGELCVGGPGVTHGYHQRPKLTADRFVDDPFTGSAESRLYKTGDIAKYLPDGQIEYLGRMDHQVKIRGFRIELGEIEALLTEHPSVENAASILHQQDDTSSNQIVAYVVSSLSKEALPGELIEYLRPKLPEYMIPSMFVKIGELPLSTSGKVDRQALPKPTDEDRGARTEYVSPETTTEKTIAEIWCDILGLSQVGVHDDFFELGGHSILAMHAVSRIEETTGTTLSIRDMFEARTVKQLALKVEAQKQEAGSAVASDAIPAVSRNAYRVN